MILLETGTWGINRDQEETTKNAQAMTRTPKQLNSNALATTHNMLTLWYHVYHKQALASK